MNSQIQVRECNVTIKHILREGNSSTNFLAKRGVWCASSFVFLEDPPSELETLLAADAPGCVYVCLIFWLPRGSSFGVRDLVSS
ncbi:ribonuclease H [Sesbania bispinosa]|nr:ribonuclease H [Sesbania bispinosa]